MKFTKYLLPVALAAAINSCDTCQLDPVLPPVTAPVDTTAATMTILEFKQQYWNSNSNSMDQIGLTADGDSILLRGRVVSTDITGNCYKQLVIRDETAAILIPLNINNVYKVYPYGTELLVNVTGLYVGMYSNLLQVGSKQEGRTSPYQVDEDIFAAAARPNGWPNPAEAQPVEVDLDFLNSIKGDATGRQEWQSQLVTINDVEFENPGQEFSPTYSSTVSQYVRDASGKRLILRFSGRSSFAHRIIPGGKGSVTGILSFYNADWQLIPCTLEDLKGFTTVSGPTTEPAGSGTETDPYNVTAAIANQGGTAWVKGYIVGCMNSNADYTMEVTAPFTVASNVYIADDPKEEISSRMLPVQLVSGSEIRTAVNLVDNPGNLGKELTIEGNLTTYFSQPGLKEPSAYKLNGEGSGNTPTPPAETLTLTRVSGAITPGEYALWADNKIGIAFTDGYNYGYMKSADCTPGADGAISTTADNLFTFAQEAKGWTIADSHGQYLYQDTTHDSFQLTKTPDMTSDYTYWTITANADGTYSIVNNGTQKTLQYDPGYKTWAAYSSLKASLPYLYK